MDDTFFDDFAVCLYSGSGLRGRRPRRVAGKQENDLRGAIARFGELAINPCVETKCLFESRMCSPQTCSTSK